MTNLELLDWKLLYQDLNEHGFAKIKNALSKEDCGSLIEGYHATARYRNTIVMERYRFGKGEYKYFSYPLPALIQQLRNELYTPLATLANAWMQHLQIDNQYPLDHDTFIKSCHAVNQLRPTPLILTYEAGGYNTLHQDLYGVLYFPFQILFVLNQEGKDYEGGEFVMTEQIPRAQSRAHVLKLDAGDALIFTTNFRPAKGSKGYYRANMKHGVSTVTSGRRYALGIIFHDAQ
ncbi:2OG-Fe(II) oxygenase [Chryseosolibacter indicus]|uniref:2OG-Fe(II) oxygenase n=1 Tax=Chryseosolibacter indicus TaxID=2782351 RepID=A0ABS5VN13_9BACT|nr:2OG-Fe(II) oxygenase [Chryseosolibacter indicus]MBT1702756.1 2OG-Fe(II) oxygenase [Chryseosolibacter indicus]